MKHGASWVVGSVDDLEVIVIGNGTHDGWASCRSVTLPSNIEKAKAYVECMRRAIKVAHRESRSGLGKKGRSGIIGYRVMP